MAGKVSPVEQTRARVAEASSKIELNQAANDLAKAAATGDAAAVKTAFGAVGGTCKSCHDDYQAK